MQTNKVVPNSARAWWLAARPKTLSGAALPVMTATALAWANGQFRLLPALLCLLFAELMQVAANFINDLFDYKKGTDGSERLGPERACAQGWITPPMMWRGIVVVLAAAAAVGLWLVTCHLSPVTCHLPLVGIGLACGVFAFLYTTLLSYCGLGDVLVYVFFGFVPVLGTYFVQAGRLCPEAWWLSVGIGLAVDTLLVLNNFRDRNTDRASGKRTLIATLGGEFGSRFYLAQGILAYGCCAALAFYGHWLCAVLPLIYLVLHMLTWRTMVGIWKGRELNRVLGLTSRNMLILGVSLVAALLLK